MLTVLATLAFYGLTLEIYLLTITWFIARTVRNAGLADPVWAFSFAPLYLLYALLSGASGPRVWAFGSLVLLWSGRLSFHLFRRWWREFPQEDSRYAALRTEWGEEANRRFYFFYLVQAGVAWLLALPWLAVICSDSGPLRGMEWAALCLGVLAVWGEMTADAQLAAFRQNPSGSVLKTGLWRYSRHPNYFFEWLTWCAFALFAGASPWGWTAWIAATAMLIFLTRFTGIKATEKAMKKKRGEEYRKYLRETSAFLPLPRF